MNTPLIEIQDLRMQRGDFTLSIDDWQLPAGEIVGLIGPNGAGKTTLLHMLHGLYPPTEGEIRVLGLEPWTHPVEVRSQVGFASVDVELFKMAVGPLIDYIAGFYPGRWNREVAEQLVEVLSVEPGWTLGELSKGQELSVRLVVALAFEPTIMLLDEPTAGLDLGHRQRLFDFLLRAVAGGERSVLISSHSLADVERISDRLLVLDQGSVREAGPIDSLIGDERTLEEAMTAWGVAG